MANGLNTNEIKSLITDNNRDEKESTYKLINKNNHYSRIIAIGIYKLVDMQSNGFNKEEATENSYLDLVNNFGYTKERVEKDVNLYKSSLDKIEKALELIEMNIKDEKRRNKERVSRTKPGQ